MEAMICPSMGKIDLIWDQSIFGKKFDSAIIGIFSHGFQFLINVQKILVCPAIEGRGISLFLNFAY